MSKVCLWDFGVNVLTWSYLRSSVFHSGGGLATIEDWVLRDLDASRGRGQRWQWGSLLCEFGGGVLRGDPVVRFDRMHVG